MQEYGNCSCIVDVNTSDVSSTAIEGVCDVITCHVWKLVVVYFLLLLSALDIFVAGMFNVSATLRCSR